MSEEWGPWIEHDGKGCPCVGKWVQSYKVSISECGCFSNGLRHITSEGIAGISPWNWDWSQSGKIAPNGKVASKIIRYRIRRPKGMAILNAILADIPAPTKQYEVTQ